MAIASLTAGAPLTAFGGDREIADAIISTLKQSESSLKGFDIDLSVDDGKVVISGTVASQALMDKVLSAARGAAGVKSIENTATVKADNVGALSYHAASESVVPASASEVPELLEEPTKMVEETVSPADAAITQDVLGKLSQAKGAGKLRNFDLDVSTVDGTIWVRGYVANQYQKDLVLGTAQRAPGAVRVVDEVTVTGQTGVRPASGTGPASSMPVVGTGTPRAFAPSTLTNGSMGPAPMQDMGAGGPAAPVPMQGGPTYGGGVPRYDQPNMPSYAWPSYAAYPNYSAVTYPKQYSASAWPYIGPFYPYPQVPLGWRKVSLEWDDGLWYLDFTHK